MEGGKEEDIGMGLGEGIKGRGAGSKRAWGESRHEKGRGKGGEVEVSKKITLNRWNFRSRRRGGGLWR